MSLAERVALLDMDEKRKCFFGEIKVLHENKSVSLPLSDVKINASVVNQITFVTQEQTFKNGFTENLEATYIFPLPGGASVHDFEMIIDEKVIKGNVKERQQAREEYAQAISEGKKASLLEQERDDIFTVQVGNIPPSKEIKVKITYSEKLAFFEDGTTEIRLPLVVAQRYIAGEIVERGNVGKGTESDTDIVPDASRITPPRLVDSSQSEVKLSINVEISTGNGTLSELVCSQHATKTSIGNNKIKVSLSNTDEHLDRDFILRWQTAQENLQNDLVYFQNNEEIYGMLTIIPPKKDIFTQSSRDIVFIVDRSGSMDGLKMTSATKACSILLNTLGQKDRFSILAFDDSMQWFQPNQSSEKSQLFTYADEAGLEKGDKFLKEINANGGTEIDMAMGEAIAAIRARKDSEKMSIIVLLTDGQIGDESRVLKRIQKEIGNTRVFTIGIDTAVNENFLKRLAVLGAGTASFVVPGEALEEALIKVSREIGNPVMTDITIKSENNEIISEEIAPNKIPDLFSNRTVSVFFKANKAGNISVSGKLDNNEIYNSNVVGKSIENNAIPKLWAKYKIFDLEDKFRIANSEGQKERAKKQIINLSVKYSILTKFTAFIAVDESEQSDSKSELRKIVQPVMQPAKWEMNAMPRMRMAAAPTASFGGVMPPPPGAPAPIGSIMQDSAPMMKRQQPKESFVSKLFNKMSSGFSSSQVYESEEESVESDESFTESSIINPKLDQQLDKIEAQKKKISNEDQELILEIKNILELYENILDSLKSGNIPDITDFKNSKDKLSAIMAESDKAFELVELQKFLKVQAVEIVNIFNNKDLEADKLYKHFEKYNSIIEKVRDEIKVFDKSSGNFWEVSI